MAVEMAHFATIIGTEDKYKRKVVKHREQGIQERERHIKEKHDNTEDKLFKLQQLLEQKPDISQHIAITLFGGFSLADLITIYEEVLSGKRKQFPLDTWNQTDSKAALIKLVRYVVLEKLQWDREQFCARFCLKIIAQFRLNTGFNKVYKRNIYPLISEAFPEWIIKPWEMRKSRVPAHFWTKQTATTATKWLIEEKLHWDFKKVSRDISRTYFFQYHLGGMLRTTDISIPEIIAATYPDYDWTYLKERHGYKLTFSQAEEIRRLYNEGVLNQRQIAQKFSVDPSQVYLIVKNKSFFS